jgi:hypothetical protein
MYSFITPAYVIATAFTDGEYISPEVVTQSEIEAAIERWIVPVVGRELLTKVASPEYQTLFSEMLMPAAATAVRLEVQPRLNISTTQHGARVVVGERNAAADNTLRSELMLSLRNHLRTQLLTLTNHLEQNAEHYPEYHPRENVLHKVAVYGGFVQIL